MQRAELALKSKEALAEIALKNWEASLIKDGKVPSENDDGPARENSHAPEKMRTDEEVARLAGVSSNTIRKVEKIQQEAIPAVQEAARKGEVSIDAAARVAKLAPEEQEAIAAEGPQAMKRAAAEQRRAKAPQNFAKPLGIRTDPGGWR